MKVQNIQKCVFAFLPLQFDVIVLVLNLWTEDISTPIERDEGEKKVPLQGVLIIGPAHLL